MKKNAVRPHTFGLALLLVVFLILCLLTFAAISTAEAHNDLMRSRNLFASLTEYQNACSYAESALRDAAREAAASPEDALPFISFTVSVNDEDDLCAEAVLKISPDTGNPYYEITGFALRRKEAEQAEESLNLMTDGRIGW